MGFQLIFSDFWVTFFVKNRKLIYFEPEKYPSEIMKIKRIAIFASGGGTNAQNIVEHFSHIPDIEISLILSNNKKAQVLDRARKLNVTPVVFSRDDFYKSQRVLTILLENQIDLIVLAGFLLLIPDYLIDHFHGRIINIHPALLPKYGGKGMFGMKVHESVISSHDIESGITIHYVNEKYDEGEIIYQARCSVAQNETPESLAKKIHVLEYEHFPKVIEKLLSKI